MSLFLENLEEGGKSTTEKHKESLFKVRFYFCMALPLGLKGTLSKFYTWYSHDDIPAERAEWAGKAMKVADFINLESAKILSEKVEEMQNAYKGYLTHVIIYTNTLEGKPELARKTIKRT